MAHILLVEDDENTREAMTDLLELGGHEVTIAIDGEQGLKLAREKTPDLILLDFSLPKMHGWAVAQELRKEDNTKAIPIVALTAHVMVATEESAMEVGCDAYMTKPLNIAQFEPWLTGFLAERGIQ